MNLKPTHFFQEEYITKYPRDKEILQDLYLMNKLLLEHDYHTVSQAYKRDMLIPFQKSKETILDCQAVNLLHHYSNLHSIKNYSVIDYSSLGHKYVSLRDLNSINHFVRGVVRSIKFKHKYDLKTLWNWRMPWESNSLPLTSLLWTNKFLDHSLIVRKSRTFIDKYLGIFPELSEISSRTRVLLICPHTDSSFAQFEMDLAKLLADNSMANSQFNSAEKIFVKQHRIAPHTYPDFFKINNREIVTINSSLSKVLPTEILLHGLSNLRLFSTISSIIFSAENTTFFPLGKISKRDQKDYGLMLNRANREWKKISFPIFN